MLVDNLSIHEQERNRLILQPRVKQTILHVLPPILHVVILNNLDLKQLIRADKRRHPRQTLSPTAADSEQQRISLRLPDHPRDPANMLAGVQKHHQLHQLLPPAGVLPVGVVLLLKLLHFHKKPLEVGDLLVDPGVLVPPLQKVAV